MNTGPVTMAIFEGKWHNDISKIKDLSVLDTSKIEFNRTNMIAAAKMLYHIHSFSDAYSASNLILQNRNGAFKLMKRCI